MSNSWLTTNITRSRSKRVFKPSWISLAWGTSAVFGKSSETYPRNFRFLLFNQHNENCHVSLSPISISSSLVKTVKDRGLRQLSRAGFLTFKVLVPTNLIPYRLELCLRNPWDSSWVLCFPAFLHPPSSIKPSRFVTLITGSLNCQSKVVTPPLPARLQKLPRPPPPTSNVCSLD